MQFLINGEITPLDVKHQAGTRGAVLAVAAVGAPLDEHLGAMVGPPAVTKFPVPWIDVQIAANVFEGIGELLPANGGIVKTDMVFVVELLGGPVHERYEP